MKDNKDIKKIEKHVDGMKDSAMKESIKKDVALKNKKEVLK